MIGTDSTDSAGDRTLRPDSFFEFNQRVVACYHRLNSNLNQTDEDLYTIADAIFALPEGWIKHQAALIKEYWYLVSAARQYALQNMRANLNSPRQKRIVHQISEPMLDLNMPYMGYEIQKEIDIVYAAKLAELQSRYDQQARSIFRFIVASLPQEFNALQILYTARKYERIDYYVANIFHDNDSDNSHLMVELAEEIQQLCKSAVQNVRIIEGKKYIRNPSFENLPQQLQDILLEQHAMLYRTNLELSFIPLEQRAAARKAYDDNLAIYIKNAKNALRTYSSAEEIALMVDQVANEFTITPIGKLQINYAVVAAARHSLSTIKSLSLTASSALFWLFGAKSFSLQIFGTLVGSTLLEINQDPQVKQVQQLLNLLSNIDKREYEFVIRHYKYWHILDQKTQHSIKPNAHEIAIDAITEVALERIVKLKQNTMQVVLEATIAFAKLFAAGVCLTMLICAANLSFTPIGVSLGFGISLFIATGIGVTRYVMTKEMPNKVSNGKLNWLDSFVEVCFKPIAAGMNLFAKIVALVRTAYETIVSNKIINPKHFEFKQQQTERLQNIHPKLAQHLLIVMNTRLERIADSMKQYYCGPERMSAQFAAIVDKFQQLNQEWLTISTHIDNSMDIRQLLQTYVPGLAHQEFDLYLDQAKLDKQNGIYNQSPEFAHPLLFGENGKLNDINFIKDYEQTRASLRSLEVLSDISQRLLI